MEGSLSDASLTPRARVLIGGMVVAVVITPLVLAVAAINRDVRTSNRLVVTAALLWVLLVLVYRGATRTYERRRRNLLVTELAEIRCARSESSQSFQARLCDQSVILNRIIEIARATVADGITDPNATLNKVRLLESYARDAQTLIEDAILEVRVETEGVLRNVEVVDLRRELSDVVARFSSPGIEIVGAHLYAYADAAMFRVIVRHLINTALNSGATAVDVSVTRDRDSVVCCVSDNAQRTGSTEEPTVPPLVASLSRALGTTIEHTQLLRRSQTAFRLPVAAARGSAQHGASPLDVLGALASQPDSQANHETAISVPPLGKITFPEPPGGQRRGQSVAMSRKSQAPTQ